MSDSYVDIAHLKGGKKYYKPLTNSKVRIQL